jgi:hypothetical protein
VVGHTFAMELNSSIWLTAKLMIRLFTSGDSLHITSILLLLLQLR